MTRPEIRFLRWKDPTRVQEADFDESVVTQELRDVLCVYERVPFRPAAAVVGPQGVIPVAPHAAPSELYDLWVMHTNFYLSEAVADAVKATPGVEVFRVWTPYRAWIGFGLLFDAERVRGEVRRNVESVLTPAGSPAGGPVWAVVRGAGGEREVRGSSVEDVLRGVAPGDEIVRASWSS